MEKTCKITGKKFTITESDLEFYKKIGLITDNDLRGLPTLCPEERSRRRMSWSNHRNLYHRNCDGTGKKIISNFPSTSPEIIYNIHYWFSDEWDQYKRGRVFDFSGEKTFFEQFIDLRYSAPLPNLQRSPEYDENSEFTNYAGKNKDCYLIFDSDKNRDCLNSYSLNSCEDVVDSFRVSNSQICYQCIDSVNCYNSAYLQNCDNCSDSYFLKNCIGCKNCFGSSNIRNKEYYFINKKYSKKEYEQKIKNLEMEKFSKIKNFQSQFSSFCQKFPQKFLVGVQNENVSGDYLINCKNSQNCFDSRLLWDCDYIQQAFDDVKSSMDCTEVGDEAQWLYECGCMGYSAYNNKFCTHQLGKTANLTYCYYTPYCTDCFGCIGLHHKKFCIFNKQYSEEEYNLLVPKIIEFMKKTGEWGEFFPIEISPFGYNLTHAFDYFPLSGVGAIPCGRPSSGQGRHKAQPLQKLQYNWTPEKNTAKYSGPKYKIPDNIKDVPDEILDKILTCEISGKNYRIIKPELEFYRKMNLPIPRICPDERHKERMKLRNPRKLWKRNCDKCQKDIETTFSPERPEKIFCEECYLDSIN